jgi:predicted MPP superfamily phosphohydrolase
LKRRTVFAWSAVAAAGLAALYSGCIEPRWIEVTRHTIAGRVKSPLRIAHLTDLHTHGFGPVEEAVVEIVKAERPDVIVITGDTATRAESLEAARPTLERLRAPLGVYAVNGNWEHWVPTPDAARIFQESGVQLLDNAARELRPDVWVVGLDDDLAGHPRFDQAFAEVPTGTFVLTLFHCPATFDRAAPRSDLCLSGHTHGGQVRLPLVGALWVPPGSGPYVDGWYSLSRSRMYVSRGVGMSIARVRFLCRPEIAIVEVVPGTPG